jgi:hypothetical protein
VLDVAADLTTWSLPTARLEQPNLPSNCHCAHAADATIMRLAAANAARPCCDLSILTPKPFD